MSQPEQLVIVPGHTAFKSGVTSLPENYYADDPWALQPFQAGEVPLFIQHIETGIEFSNADPKSVLIFSGGFTREDAGLWSEAGSYFVVARDLMGQYACEGLLDRTYIEDEALDSFQNVEKSLELYARVFGQLPLLTTVIGFGFKEERFMMHAGELGIASHFRYINRNDPANVSVGFAGKCEEDTRAEFEKFPRGDGGVLLEKRQARNFSDRRFAYGDLPGQQRIPMSLLTNAN